MDGETKAMPHIIAPLALVNFTFFGNKLALTMGSSKVPLPLVLGPIRKHDFSLSVSEAAQPLAFVDVSTSLVLILMVDQAALQ
jgi:hypothetical protein